MRHRCRNSKSHQEGCNDLIHPNEEKLSPVSGLSLDINPKTRWVGDLPPKQENRKMKLMKTFTEDMDLSVYAEENGELFLDLESVAIGLGFVQNKVSQLVGKTYVRWERVNKYLKEIECESFPTSGERKLIPEWAFYMLAMKADNEAAKQFQMKVAKDILPSIRKNGFYVSDNITKDQYNKLLAKIDKIDNARKYWLTCNKNKTTTIQEMKKNKKEQLLIIKDLRADKKMLDKNLTKADKQIIKNNQLIDALKRENKILKGLEHYIPKFGDDFTCVYIQGDKSVIGRYKIGMTSDLNNREMIGNTNNPEQYLIAYRKCNNNNEANQLESILHSLFIGCNLQCYGKTTATEWFYLTKEQLEYIVKKYNFNLLIKLP